MPIVIQTLPDVTSCKIGDMPLVTFTTLINAFAIGCDVIAFLIQPLIPMCDWKMYNYIYILNVCSVLLFIGI